MITTRHEEYIELENKLPFRLGIQLNRNLHCLSTSANWHENLEIQICNSGNGYVLLDGEKKIFSENDIVVINSNVIHYTSTENTLTYSCLNSSPKIPYKYFIQAFVDPPSEKKSSNLMLST